MQGNHKFSAKLFYNWSLEELIPGEHILRRFESAISLDFLYEETKPYYSHTGQPSVDPVVLFKMMLLGYLFGISSERRLAEEIKLNLAYRWYLGYDIDEATPNHSVLSKARRRFPEQVFGSIFERVVQLCRGVGLVKNEAVYLDSTLIKANASLDSFVEIKQEPAAYIKQIYEENSAEASDSLGDDKVGDGRYNGTVDPSKMGRRRQEDGVNKRWRSTTDPEADIVYRRGRGRQAAFKGHLAVDGGGRVITAVEVSAGTAEDITALDLLIRGHTLRSGEVPSRIVADSHYGCSEVYHYLDQKGIEAIIPPRRTDKYPGFFKVEDFSYDAVGDCYICPQGEPLRLRSFRRALHRKDYRAEKRVCDVCTQRARCTTGRTGGRSLSIDSFIKQAQETVESQAGRFFLRRRQTLIEGVIGEAKSYHLLRRALFRGQAKLKLQLLLTATVLNLKRLIKWLRKKWAGNHLTQGRLKFPISPAPALNP